MVKTEKVERISTRIPGLDGLIGGGILRGYSILICGTEGTGKSVTAMQMAYQLALAGEGVLYISFDSKGQPFYHQATGLNMGFAKLQEEKKFFLMRPDYVKKRVNFESFIQSANEVIHKFGITIVILDSLAKFMNVAYYPVKIKDGEDRIIEIYKTERGERDLSRRDINEMILTLKGTEHEEITTIIIDEADNSGVKDTLSGFAEFDCDGVILLKAPVMGTELTRTLQVKKMRASKIDGGVHDLEFTKDGVVVK